MAAIISDKFRIFNASQFLESMDEAENTNMYFFVGRPQRWDSYLEIYQPTADFVVGQFVYVGGTGPSAGQGATFFGQIEGVTENSLLLSAIGPNTAAAPAVGSLVKGHNGTADTGAEALSGVYRYATEDVPPAPIDNQAEKYEVYDDLIAAKKITTDYARQVIRRYNWNPSNNPVFDMWKPDYSKTTTGQTGKPTSTGEESIADAKFYLVNGQYEVFKCLYNGEDQGLGAGNNTVQLEPTTNPGSGAGSYDAATGIFWEYDTSTSSVVGRGYKWKYMYTIPTNDVIRFYSTDFMPIALKPVLDGGGNVVGGNATRHATEQLAAANPNAIDVVYIESNGTNLPNGLYYAPIVGDGSDGIVEINISGGTIQTANVIVRGTGYTYGSVHLKTGIDQADAGWTGAPYGLYGDGTAKTPADHSALGTGAITKATVGATATGAIEVILPPQGGHGANFEEELNAKRVMTNIRLEYAEGDGDFPVDNDFRRIGIIRDPFAYGTTNRTTASNLNGLFALKLDNVTADYQVDELITQTLPTGGEARGTVVSWKLDASSPTPTAGTPGSGVLKYMQTPALHQDDGVVRAFIADAGQAISGEYSLATGAVTVGDNSSPAGSGITFNNGLATPEIENNSGEVIYVENRRLITRAEDQIEDIKLVIEF